MSQINKSSISLSHNSVIANQKRMWQSQTPTVITNRLERLGTDRNDSLTRKHYEPI